MNKQNKNGISWTDYTWNPVSGCKHDCWYCYAKKIAMRFTGNFEPTFHPERLIEKMPKKPSKIFVCSMADLFGDWVHKDWIELIIQKTRENPQHTFQFLTKNPKRYLEFKFPKNCWLGVTIDGTEDEVAANNKISFLERKNNYRFISFEPLLGDVGYLSYDVDLVIVGAMTGSNAIKPEKEWIESIKHPNIYWKNNIKKYL